MRSVKNERYQKRRSPRQEDISFSAPGIELQKRTAGPSLSDKKRTTDRSKKRTDLRPEDRTTEPTHRRSDSRTNARDPAPPTDHIPKSSVDNSYVLTVPETRVRVRHSFDIFEDQKLALDRLQMATRDVSGDKPGLGEMVQTALDDYIRHRAAELPNATMLAPDGKRLNAKEPAHG